MKEFYKKNILITGGTGSFGQSAVEYLLKYSKLNKGENLLVEPQHQQNINLLVQTFEPDKIGGKYSDSLT